MFSCFDCGHQEKLANCACNDRNCPSCGAAKRAEWLDGVSSRYTAPRYFHVVFTLPHELNGIAKSHASQFLSLLCKSAATTLLSFAADEKHLGGTPFLMTVLHTWTQDLTYHAHVHCLISAGALSKDLKKWLEPKNKNFLFPVGALSKSFRSTFLDGLETLVSSGKVNLGEQYQYASGWLDFRSSLPKKWVVYCKPPYNGKDVVIKYFAQYTNRSGISDSRLVEVTARHVVLRKKRDNAEPEAQGKRISPGLITLTHETFFMRFFQHVLPKGFHRIRHYGLSSPRCSVEKIDAAKNLLQKIELNVTKKAEEATTPLCPKCKGAHTHVATIRKSNKLKRAKCPRKDTS